MQQNRRAMNLLGALATAVSDEMGCIAGDDLDHGASAAAALITLGHWPGQGITSLAATLKLSHSATVRLVDRLLRAGLVSSRVGRDRRSVVLALTRSGWRTQRSIIARRQARLADLLAPLASAEQSQLVALMEKILAGATRSIIGADQLCRFCDLVNCPQDTCPVERRAVALRAHVAPRPGQDPSTGNEPHAKTNDDH